MPVTLKEDIYIYIPREKKSLKIADLKLLTGMIPFKFVHFFATFFS